MIVCEWKDFSTDTEVYTQKIFEELVNDEFEAMMFIDHSIPDYIWTSNFVCIIKRGTRMIDEISITKIPRNPVCQ
ncbi:hypothetical protein [Halalkalibacter krulwichiae]|uniref:Uncharacterized protein n=1 Tax=Halalkalibacter krulwichiae TaxID=199441 RepID=A0A1X9M840_9BACI|nr:hypothetical protein [Halalkalibacter krulwichiae]ARK29567.1 hypothetical protein BkAM31D_06655 [Halalkalibacter krulwichiae]